MVKIDKSKVDKLMLLKQAEQQFEVIKTVAAIYEKNISANFACSFLVSLGVELIIEASSRAKSFEDAQQDIFLAMQTIQEGVKSVFKDKKEVTKNIDFTEQENKDVLFALEILDKNKAELEFAKNVLRELKTKTMFLNMGKKYVMTYPSFKECKKIQETKTENIEITKH
jgi:hypothetical protein